MRIKLIIYTENLLEKTNFKFGFCGVKPQIANDHLYSLPFFSKLKLAFYYLGRYVTNSSYFNSSLYDSLGAYFSSYLMAHDYLYLYRYIKWDEGRISSILTKKYHWERANDTSTTWRIGDGTAAFYNYIYYCVAGFTENDTFRSNQIREGVLNRNEALKNVRAENKPRPDSIRWYCETIGIDFEETIKKINAIPKIYEK